MDLKASRLLVVVALLASCGRGNPSSRPATEAEGRQALAAYVELSKTAPDAATYCVGVFTPLTCQDQWRMAGGVEGVPKQPPQVVNTRLEGDFRVLVVCGVDGKNHPYRGDFPILPIDKETQQPRASLPVFWYGNHFSGEQDPNTTPKASAKPLGSEPDGC